jgi:hypothetical protein
MRTLHLLSALALAAPLAAQWNTPSVNTPVRAANGVICATPLSTAGPEGSTYITWFEQVGGPYVLRMQRLDVNGVPLWDPAGLVVSNAPQNSALFRYDLTTDAAGHAVVAFQDERTGTLDVAAARVSPDGAAQWGTDGVHLPTSGSTGLAPAVGGLSNGRIVFAWTTDRSPATVAWRVLSADGTPDPLGTQEITATGNLGRPRIIPTSDGGFWLQYVEQTGNFLSPGTLKAIRFTPALAATPPVTVCTSTIAGFFFPQPVPDGHDGFYVAINTGNVGNPSLTDVHVTRLRANGSTWSVQGTPVEVGTTTQRYCMTATPALVSDASGVMMAYRRTNTNQDQGGIAVQRFDTAGTRLLGTLAVEVLPLSAALPAPFANAAVPGGIVCTLMQGGFGANTLSAYRIGLNGAVLDPPGLIDVCTVSSGKDDPTLVPFRNAQAVAVWMDERSGTGIYAQNIVVDDASSIAEREAPAIRVIMAPEPTLLLPGGFAPATLRVFAAEGRMLHAQRLQATPAGTRIPLPEHLLRPGAHVAVITTANDSQAVRFVME